jgi:hypothetical protein
MNRRQFLGASLAAAGASSAAPLPWYRRTWRWGQTNITERDPVRYDVAFWRTYWKRTETQGVIVNAGGIVAYYPSKFPLHHRAESLGDRDLFGELTAAAHADGLVVLARMDSNRAAEDFYRAHPDWFAVDAAGKPYRAADKYITCVNSPYYDEYIPGILREICDRSHPEGFTDNSWSGLSRDRICYCIHCRRKFREHAGRDLPQRHDWDDPVYRQWIEWSYARRIEIWDINNRAAHAAGGPDCLWIGMNSGSIPNQSRQFRDFREICRRAPMILLDHQSRSDSAGFQENGDTGKLVHGILGWDKAMPESMALYQAGRTPFRLSAKPAAEARMWMVAGIAGGIQPWWHHVGAYHEDRRAYRTAEPIYRWWKAHEPYLIDRVPVASVGLVWSQRNCDYFGRDQAAELVEQPYRGMAQALVRARIPYLPVHVDDLERDAPGRKLLILPNLAALSDRQAEAIRRFAAGGGAILATGAASLCTEYGDLRKDFALADLFGAHVAEKFDPRRVSSAEHSYLRIGEGARHPVLRGFEETAILPYGGALRRLRLDAGAAAPLTYIPPFPVYPPETAWMRTEKTDIPGLVLKGQVAYLAADIDRRFFRDNLPDHGDLLANLVRWAAGASIPLAIEGRGLVDCHLYRQPRARDRRVLHIVNLTSAGAWRAPVDELIPIGPLKVRVKAPASRARVRLLVAGAERAITARDGWVEFEIPSILDHEVAVIA